MKRLLLLIAASVFLVACGSEEEDEGAVFDGETAELEMIKIDIKKTEVIDGNLAIWYDVTNKTDESIDPIMAWLAVFEAHQGQKLSIGELPDMEHSDTQMKPIKENSTVENSISYELLDESEVELIAKQQDKEIGKRKIEVK